MANTNIMKGYTYIATCCIFAGIAWAKMSTPGLKPWLALHGVAMPLQIQCHVHKKSHHHDMHAYFPNQSNIASYTPVLSIQNYRGVCMGARPLKHYEN